MLQIKLVSLGRDEQGNINCIRTVLYKWYEAAYHQSLEVFTIFYGMHTYIQLSSVKCTLQKKVYPSKNIMGNSVLEMCFEA